MDVRERLDHTRRITVPWDDDVTRGMTAARLDGLLARWAEGDPSEHAQHVDALGWETAGDLRVVHRRAADPDAPVVVLLHGWPDSVLRFERVLPLLRDAHVVVPALPGFPFAAPTSGAVPAAGMATAVADALAALGYDHYIVSGGDVGGIVAEILAGAHPERVAALHLTNVAPQRARTVDPATLDPEAADYLRRTAGWFPSEGAYVAVQSTRPNTLAVALGDSPAGLAAWIGEKLLAWSDGPAFSDDDLVRWIAAYWDTGAIGTSFAVYVEPVALPPRVEVPTVLSVFAHDIKPEPRAYAEAFLDVREFVEHADGGHFAAWEQPGAYVEDLRRAVALATRRRE